MVAVLVVVLVVVEAALAVEATIHCVELVQPVPC